MVVLDTSVWIEFLKANSPYFEEVSDLLERNEVMGVSPVFGELLQGARDARERSMLNEFWSALPKATESDLFIRAGEESGKKRLFDRGIGLIDCAILCAARESTCSLWTLDKKLLGALSKEERYTPRQS
jgi:hypothetical protein